MRRLIYRRRRVVRPRRWSSKRCWPASLLPRMPRCWPAAEEAASVALWPRGSLQRRQSVRDVSVGLGVGRGPEVRDVERCGPEGARRFSHRDSRRFSKLVWDVDRRELGRARGARSIEVQLLYYKELKAASSASEECSGYKCEYRGVIEKWCIVRIVDGKEMASGIATRRKLVTKRLASTVCPSGRRRSRASPVHRSSSIGTGSVSVSMIASTSCCAGPLVGPGHFMVPRR